MSSIDKRIVQMQFDNQGFERGVDKTMKSLDKLNESLKMKNANTGLSEVGKGVNSLTNLGMGALGRGVDAVSSKFNALGIIAATALMNITNKAIDMGTRVSKALSIEPIMTGFSEYETKMGAIQTILTNTESKGTTLEDVTAVLDELNQYADLTIYNFAEMTRNIGTFTAAGVDLETSALAIKGIANLAAGSGSNAQQASTAMYQLSQALAAGKVGLQDWNSVVNAGMGGELFKNALIDQAKSMGIYVDESKPFRETLQDNWLTSDVLIKTLEKFAKDESLIKAATEVKTFTQLIDTMKESVQSGWAVSWEHIIGDKEEAAALFTSIKDGFDKIIAPSTNARNGMLKFWNEYGGREAIIEGLSNVMQSFLKIMNGLGMAWEMVFPPMTGKRLVELSEKFRDLTEKFKITDQTAGKIGAVFKGILEAFLLVKDAAVSLIDGISPIGKVFDGMGKSLLDGAQKVGLFISSLRDTAKEQNIFAGLADNIKTAVGAIADFIIHLKDNVAKMMGYLGNLDFVSFFKAFTQGFKGIADFLSPIIDQIASVIGTVNFDTLFGLVKAGSAVEIVKSLRGMFEEISGSAKSIEGMFTDVRKPFDSFKDIGVKISETFDVLKGTLTAFTNEINARILLKIATAVAILAGALLLIASIDTDKMLVGLAGMGVIFAELALAYNAMAKGGGLKGIWKLGGFLVSFSVAILLLAAALKMLSDTDPAQMAVGLIGFSVALGTVVVATKLLKKSKDDMTKAAKGLVIFGAALIVMAYAIEKLGSIDTAVMGNGLVGLAVLLAELAIFMKVAKFDSIGIKSATAIVVFAASLLVLQKAVEAFGSMDVNQVIIGLAGIAGVLAGITLFTKKGGSATDISATGKALIIMGAALAILAGAMNLMGSLSWEELAIGMTGMAGALLMIGIATKAIKGPQLQSVATGMTVMGAALAIIGAVIKGMGQMTWGELAKGLIALGGALLILSTAMDSMWDAMPGAQALLVISLALAVLTPQLLMLSSMDLPGLLIALGALAGTFIILGVAGKLLKPVVDTLLALAGIIALIGLGAMACGAGLALVGVGLGLVGAAVAGSGLLIVEFLRQLINLLPNLGQKAAEFVINFVAAFVDATPKLVAGFTAIVTALLETFRQVVPLLVEVALEIIVAFVEGLAKNVPLMVDAGLKLITGFLEGIAANIGGITTAAIDIVVNFIDAIASRLGNIISSGINLALSFIEGVADGLEENKGRIKEAIRRVIKVLLTTGGEVLAGGVQGFIEGGKELLDGLIEGIKIMWPKVKEAVKSAIDKAKEVASNLGSTLWQAGKDLVQGFINGIASMISNVASTASSIAASARDSVLSFLGINSPSRVFMEIGKFTVQGLAVGLERYSGLVEDPARMMAKNVVDSVEKPLSKIDSLLASDINASPVITPVMDLSNVEAGARRLGSMIGNSNMRIGGPTMRLAGTVGTIQNGNGNAEVISALKDLKDNISTNNTSYNINGITYDDGSNVANAIETLVRAARIERRM